MGCPLTTVTAVTAPSFEMVTLSKTLPCKRAAFASGGYSGSIRLTRCSSASVRATSAGCWATEHVPTRRNATQLSVIKFILIVAHQKSVAFMLTSGFAAPQHSGHLFSSPRASAESDRESICSLAETLDRE